MAQAFVEKNKDKYLHFVWLTQKDDNPQAIFLNDVDLLNSLQLNFEGSNLSADDQLKLIFSAMRQLVKPEKPNLLVIDNATAALSQIREIPTPPEWQVLVTSRQSIGGYEEIPLGFLSENAAYQLFIQHYTHSVTVENTALIHRLLKALGYHTLSIELYAKTAQHLNIPLQRLEQKLQNSLQLGYETAISSPHRQGKNIEQVFPYLVEIFQLGELSEKEEKLLRLWTLVPPQFVSLDFVLMLWGLHPDKDDVEWYAYMNAAKKLAQKGWLDREEQENGSTLYSMHRVIREVLHQKWVIADYETEYLPFAESVGSFLYEGNHNVSLRTYLIPFGENLLHFLDKEKHTSLLGALATAYQKIHRLDAALEAYQEALDIYRRLAQANPQAFLPAVATTLNNLAVLHSDKNEFAAALEAYQEALNIRRRLAQANPQAFLPDVAGTLNNLGILHRAKNEFAAALEAYQEALDIRRRLAQANPQAFLPDVAMTLNNLANLHSAKNEFAAALEAYQEALDIYRRLAQANPQAFLPNLAMTMVNLSIFYLQSKPDRKASVELAKEVVLIALQFQQIPIVMQYARAAIQVLKAWEVDVEEWLKEQGGG
ncbi:MAG: tetratricopeptide repeat protein [Chitinophagales bacterium]